MPKNFNEPAQPPWWAPPMAFIALATLLLSAPALARQPASVEGPVAPNQVPASEVASGFEAGVGRLVLAGSESPLAYTLTLTGDMFSLQSLATHLGGAITIGPLGESHTLDIFDTRVIIGPDSPVMTIGDEIVRLSRAPLAGTDELMVPLDLLRRTWGEHAGYAFVWDRSARTLMVERRASRELDIDLDLVHIAGVSTLVMRLFVDDPSYRFEAFDGGFDVIFPGDSLVLRGPMPRAVAMIAGVTLERDRVSVQLDPGAFAAEPYRVDRRGVQLIVDVAVGRPQASSSPSGQPPIGARTNSSQMRIVLDPGHGGSEVGAVGTRGTLEKDLTLQLARRLRQRLERRMPVRVLLTRNSDVAVVHETRTAIANQNEADLFISLHLNSVPGGGGSGAETYFLNLEASDRRAEEAARIENGDSSGGDGLQLMLWDLAQSQHMAESQAFARLVQSELNGALGLRDRGVKQAPFRVLVGAAMPAVLVEFGFLSNADEEAKLQQPDYQDELVDAIVRAVRSFRELKLRKAAGAPAGGGELN